MKSFARAAVLVLVAAAALGASIGRAQAAAPILIKRCTIIKPRHFSHQAGGTHIVFVNLGKRTAASVVFAVGYRNASMHYMRRVTDVGSFAPRATISHNLSLYNDVTYSGAQTSFCAPVEVKWQGGTIWMAPARP